MFGLNRLRLNSQGGSLGFAIQRALFNNGEQGLWYDYNDDSTIFQDSAGTTAATWGDPVGLVLDKSKGLAQGANLTASLDLSVAPWSSAGTVSSITANSFSTTGVGGRFNDSILAPNGLYEIIVEYTKTGTNTFSVRTQTAGPDIVSSAAGSGTLRGYGFSGSVDQLYFRLSDTGSLTIVSASIRLLAGNHAIQSTSGARPIRGRMPKRGVVNLVVSSEDVSATAWAANSARVTRPDANTIVETAETGVHIAASASVSYTSGLPYTETVTLSKGSLATAPDIMQLSMGGPAFGTGQFANVNVLTGAVVSVTGATCTSEPSTTVPGAWRFTYTATATATASTSGISIIFCNNNGAATRLPSYLGAITADCKVYRAQKEQNSVATAYQKVGATAFDITESGQPSCGYLSFNGSNQWMQTAAAVDFSATDEMSVFAGGRRLADAQNIICELGVVSTNPGCFGFFNPSGNAAGTRVPGFRSEAAVAQDPTEVLAPYFYVQSGSSKRATPTVSVRLNGTTRATSTSAQGAGNYANAVVYFGSRAGTSVFLNGLMFSTIIRGKLTSDTLLTRTEQYVARQTPTVTL